MDKKKCVYCANYYNELGVCKFCHYEYQPLEEDWDIFSLGDYDYIEIQNHLADNGIECILVDTWANNNIAYIIGCNERVGKIAEVLGIHKECIYEDGLHGLIILNLFQEKYLRGLIGDDDGLDT